MKKLVGIKSRDGGKSASLTYPVPVKSARRVQKVRLPVGAIRIDDDGESQSFGAGFIKFASGYSLSLLNDADQAAAQAWLEQASTRCEAGGAASPRASMLDVNAKLDELLELMRVSRAQADISGTLGPVEQQAVLAPVYVLPEGPGPDEDSEGKLLRLLRTFNAAAAEIVPMMPKAAGAFHSKYKFRPETVEEVERSWVLAATMDKRLNGRGQLKRTGPREEVAQARFGTADPVADIAEVEESAGL
jgi:hypothetical protein